MFLKIMALFLTQTNIFQYLKRLSQHYPIYTVIILLSVHIRDGMDKENHVRLSNVQKSA